jgi:hypothetical protein
MFDTLTWSNDTGTLSLEQPQTSSLLSTASSTSATTTELPSVLTLLLPIINGPESTSVAAAASAPPLPPPQLKQSSVMFSSNNGVIDDPLIQSLAAEQAASAHNYDPLLHRHKRVSDIWGKCFVIHLLGRFDDHYAMVIKQLVLQISNFYLVY